MAVTYLDRFILPIGTLRKEFIYVNNAVNDDIVKTSFSKVYTADIKPVNYTGTFTAIVCVEVSIVSGREVLNIRDPDGVAGTVYEIEVIGQ